MYGVITMISFLEIKHFKMADDADSGVTLSSKKKKGNKKVNTLKSCNEQHVIQLLVGVETAEETTKGIWKQFYLGHSLPVRSRRI